VSDRSIEDLESRRSDEPAGEEEGDAALERLIDEMADRHRAEPGPEPHEPAENEFACHACHLIFSRSCLVDHARVLCSDCAALAARSELRPREVPHVDRIHHPCPACSALIMVPEREEVSCGFVCPSCRVHLSKRGGHVHLVWNHRDAVIEGVEP
jgi:hypothetical protein